MRRMGLMGYTLPTGVVVDVNCEFGGPPLGGWPYGLLALALGLGLAVTFVISIHHTSHANEKSIISMIILLDSHLCRGNG